MDNLNPVGQLAQYYSRSPAIRALINLLAGGGSLDVLLHARAQEIAEERAETFFEELSNGTVELTPELVQSEDFIHRYVITAKAAANTYRRDKIRQFARLLKSSLRPDEPVGTDEYEEYLHIIDELSHREFLVLTLLEEWESSCPPGNDETDLQRATRFWDGFLSEAKQLLGVSEDEVNAILARLNRTGCYTTFTGAFLAYTGNKGRLTDMYHKVKRLIS